MYVCFICDKQFVNFSLMRHHVNKQHELLSIKKLVCKQDGCLRQYHTVNSLYKHIKKVHVTCSNEGNETSLLESNYDDATCSVNEASVNEGSVTISTDNKIEYDLTDVAYVLQFFSCDNFNRSNITKIIQQTSFWANKRFGANSHKLNYIDSEHKIKKALNSLSLWIEPKEMILDYIESFSKVGGKQVLSMQPFQYYIVPLKDILEKLFSNDVFVNMANDYMLQKNDCIGDVKDGKMYENLPSNTFPFVIFFDEIETGNCLGSHKTEYKVGVFYFSLRCFPPIFYSKLGNIYLYAVVPSKATEYKYMNQIVSNLTQEINYLQTNGIEIKKNCYKFKLVGLIGDNLGQHQVLGFSGSFAANYPCRVCRATKQECKNMCKENSEILRNRTNYTEDVEVDNQTLTGIKYNCPLNDVIDYHVTENMLFDIMHDMAEGVCNVGMSLIIKHFIDKQFFTLKQLNEMIYSFPFNTLSNRPPELCMKNIVKEDLSYSAAEMINFTLYFSLLVGNIIPHDDPVWNYYLTLREILDILLQKELSSSAICYLDTLIQEHHSLYITLFNRHLKPKHHHLLHYKRALINTGPLCHNWAMRFESKNYQTKLFAKTIRCRINVCKSLAIRHQYLFANNLLSIKINPFYFGCNIDNCGPEYKDDDVGECYKWVSFRGVRYERGAIVSVLNSINESNHFLPTFVRIDAMKKVYNDVLLVCNKLVTIGAESHLAAYMVSRTSLVDYVCYKKTEVSSPKVYYDDGTTILISATGL